MIRTFMPGFAVLLLSIVQWSAGAAPSLGFFAGSYRVVGLDPETQSSYQGVCDISKNEDGTFTMKRVIAGSVVLATFDQREVFNHEGNSLGQFYVTRFTRDGEEFEVLYSSSSANFIVGDNYGMLSGWVRSTAIPPGSVLQGFEMLVPTTEPSAKEFKIRVKSELQTLVKEGKGDDDLVVQRAKRVLEEIEVDPGEQ